MYDRRTGRGCCMSSMRSSSLQYVHPIAFSQERLPSIQAATLTTSQACIIFRFVEFSLGFDSSITNHEAYFYCLDALPMFTAIFLFNAFYPGRVLVGSESEFEKKSRRQKKEEEEKQRKNGGLEEKRGSEVETVTPDGSEGV